MKLFNTNASEIVKTLDDADLQLVSGSGPTSETFSGSGGTSSSSSSNRGGETNNTGRYSECGAGRNGGPVICVPNKE